MTTATGDSEGSVHTKDGASYAQRPDEKLASKALSEQREGTLRAVRLFFRRQQPDWFATLTFSRRNTTLLQAQDSLRLWLRTWRKRCPENPIRLVCWSAERQHDGCAHLHLLCHGGSTICNSHCDLCWPRWKGELIPHPKPHQFLNEGWYHHNGIARWYPYDDSIGAGGATYAMKYLFKESDTDWGFWEIGKDY